MFSADRRSHVRSPEKWHRLENEFFNRIDPKPPVANGGFGARR
jgi:hypothetical protein